MYDLQVVEGPLQLFLGAGADQMAKDVFKVVDENLPPVRLQLDCESTNEGGACGAGLSCQVRQKHLERPLQEANTASLILQWHGFSRCVCAAWHTVRKR